MKPVVPTSVRLVPTAAPPRPALPQVKPTGRAVVAGLAGTPAMASVRPPVEHRSAPAGAPPPAIRKPEGSGKPVSKTGQGRSIAVPPSKPKKKRKTRKTLQPIDLEPLKKSTGGRPFALPAEGNDGYINLLGGLGSIMCTWKECAAVLGVTEQTLSMFFKRVPDAKIAYDEGKEKGKASLRRSQFDLAKKNATMAIFLGLNYLDQKDRREIAGDPNNPIEHRHAHIHVSISARDAEV